MARMMNNNGRRFPRKGSTVKVIGSKPRILTTDETHFPEGVLGVKRKVVKVHRRTRGEVAAGFAHGDVEVRDITYAASGCGGETYNVTRKVLHPGEYEIAQW